MIDFQLWCLLWNQSPSGRILQTIETDKNQQNLVKTVRLNSKIPDTSHIIITCGNCMMKFQSCVSGFYLFHR